MGLLSDALQAAREDRRQGELQSERARAAGALVGGIQVNEPGQAGRLIEIAKGLASADQTTQQQASGLLSAFAAEQGTGMTPEDQQRLADMEMNAQMIAERFPGQMKQQQLANESLEQSIRQQEEAFPYQQELQRQQIAMGFRQIEAFDRTGGLAPPDLSKPQPVSNPYTQRLEVAFVPGTTEQIKSQAQADTTKGMLEAVNEMRSLIDQFGGVEKWNDEAIGRARTIHVDLLQRLAADTGAGALGEGERDFWLQGVPDMTDWGRPGLKDRIAASYDQLYLRLGRQYMDRGAANPYNIIDFSLLDGRIISPESARFIQANQPRLR